MVSEIFNSKKSVIDIKSSKTFQINLIMNNYIIKRLIILLFLLFFASNVKHFSDFSNLHENRLKIEEYNEISTNNGVISLQNYKIFWFIQISDTHFLWYDNDKDKRFRKFLNETYKQINPLFIFHTGDIVHANNGLEQNQIEWENYRKALNDNNMNSSIYMDVIGNHDAANNPNFTYFLNYSMMGVSFNTTQYAFNHSFAFGNYAFIGLDTAKESYNIFEYGFKGFLNGKEIDWYENELEKYKDFDKIFVFGHNPLEYPPFYNIISDVGLSGKDFYELNEEYNVSFYLSGHIHENSFQYYDDLLQITTGNFDQGGGIYRIVSLDNNRLSTSIGYVGDWPQAIITNPPGEDYSLKELNTVDEKLRVLAWDPNGIKSVKWSLIDSRSNLPLINWRPLVRINSKDPLWEGNLSFDYCGNLLLKVKVEGDSGIIIKEIRYNLCATSINTPSLIVLFTLVMGSVALIFVGNHYIPKIHNEVKKRRERNLDKSFPT